MKLQYLSLLLLAGCVDLPKESIYYKPMPKEAEVVPKKIEPTVKLKPAIKYGKPKEEKPAKVNLVRQFNIYPCDACNGHGRFRCDICAGVGLLYTPSGMRNIDGEWIQKEVQCSNCQGIGSLMHADCQGTGKVLIER